MPEGPEVTFMKHQLNSTFKNCILKKIEIKSGRYIRHGIPQDLFYFIKKNLPLKIKQFNNKGKFLYIDLEDNHSIGIVLAMTGHILFSPSPHSHYHFITDCGTFYIEDVRNFASIHIFTENELERKLKSIGPDLLNDKVSDKEFIKRIRKYPHKSISQVLLDQKLISGIGNYLRADGLYKAKINPFKKVEDISDDDLKLLKKETKKIMKWALKSHIQHKYMKSYKFKVYGRKLTNKKEEVKAQKSNEGRTIYWVPTIQT